MKTIKRIALLTALVMAFLVLSASAETVITVSGTGETRISADTAVITLGVSARDQDVQKAQQKVNTQIASVRKALTEKGVAEADINTNYMNIYALYDYGEDNREQVSSYSANSSLIIRVTDMDSVGLLIDAAFAAGANTLDGISFSASDTESAKAESLRKAVADAKAKAEVLAEAAGLKITAMDAIAEGGVYSYDNVSGNYAAKSAYGEEAAADGTVVKAAKLIVSATVTVTFRAE